MGVSSAIPPTRRLVLRNGQRVFLHFVHPDDEQGLKVLLDHLSPENRRLRFFTAACDLAGAARDASHADGRRHIGLIATDGEDEVFGHAMARQSGPADAEVAVEVADALHGLGLGTQLLIELVRLASQHGVRRVVAEVLPENREMLAVFRDGFGASERLVDGCVLVSFDSGAWRSAAVRFPIDGGAGRSTEVAEARSQPTRST